MRNGNYKYRPRDPEPGPFIPCKRQNADWKLRWQQLFAGRDPAVNRGKIDMTREQ